MALLLVALPWPTPTVAAQGSGAIDVSDATDDVRLGDPALGPPAPRSEGLDLTRVEILGESGVSFIIRVSVRDLIKEIDNTDAVNNGILITSCFDIDGTRYAAAIRFRLGIGVLLGTRLLGLVDGDCVPGTPVKFSKTVSIGYDVHVDLVRSQATIAIDRLKLLELTGTAPARGAKIGGLFVMMHDGNMNRFDQAPDGGKSDQTLTLAFDTANLGALSASPVSNVPDSACDGRIDFPAYAVESGGTQGVPIEFHNSGPDAMQVNFQVHTIGGKDWKPRVVPTLEVPPSSSAGNTTLTAIVTLPGNTNHKECTVLSVLGVTSTGEIGETGVIVVAIQPPSAERKKLWLHTDPYAQAGADCASSHSWLNVLEDDADDAGVDIAMKLCRDELITGAETRLSTLLDVSPNYDIVLNTSAPGIDAHANAVLYMRSDVGESASQLHLTLLTIKNEVIAEGSTRVTIGSSPTEIKIPMNIAFTRDVRAEGDPSRTLRSTDGFAWVIQHIPDEAKTEGTVYLISEGTHLELPVWTTIKRNANNPGAQGGLISMRPNAALPEFAAPGAPRVVTFTVLNEGVQSERVLVDVTIEGVKNWTAQVVPEPPLELAPGQRTTFSVGITPRPEAEESETAHIDVIVHSERDPTARNSIAFQLKATRSGVTGDEFPGVGDVKEKGGLPGPGAIAFLAALGAALGLLRRRIA